MSEPQTSDQQPWQSIPIPEIHEEQKHFDHFPRQPKLLNANAEILVTREQYLEIARCAADPIYFIRRYCKIVHVDRGVIPFELFNYQERMIETALDNRYTIVKFPRQSGKTTAIAGLVVWLLRFQDNYAIGLLAHKESQAREILTRVRAMIEQLPVWLQRGVSTWNKTYVELDNGSWAMAAATSSGAIRGKTLNTIYLDEFAHIPPNLADEFYTSVLPTISSGETTKVIVTSTPKGMNLFFKLWNDSVNEKNDYKRVSIHYSETPGRDEEWAEAMRRTIGDVRFEQEFGCSFLGSSFTLINANKIEALHYETPKAEDLYMKIFEAPEGGHNYVLAVDTSDGVHRDFSTFVVVDVTQLPYKVVATYRNNTIEPLMFPDIIFKIANYYHKANVICENNNMGQQVANVLYFDYEYEHIFTSVKEMSANEIDEGSPRIKPGVRTTRTTKRIGCSNLKTLVESDQLVINDFAIIEEFSRFVRTKTSYAADEGAHDDLVMALVIFAWLTTQPYFMHLTDTNMRTNLYNQRIKQVQDSMMPFGVIDNGIQEDSSVVTLEGGVDFDRFLFGED